MTNELILPFNEWYDTTRKFGIDWYRSDMSTIRNEVKTKYKFDFERLWARSSDGHIKVKLTFDTETDKLLFILKYI